MVVLEARRAKSKRALKLSSIFFLASLVIGSAVAESAFALTAPLKIGSDIPYYYVSDGISDNGRFPNTWVGFYWNSDTGDRTITYNPRKCNDGGYDDSSDGDPRVTIYGINANGTVNLSNVIYPTTHINACHDSSASTPFTFNLSSTLRDTNINMKGVVVRVDSYGDGSSRAWFTLETPEVDGAAFGAMGGTQGGNEMTIGYSRDFDKDSAGGYYDLETGFGSCDSTARDNQPVRFFDTDNAKYQSAGSGDDNALRIAFQNVPAGTWIDNDATIISNLSNISRRSATPDIWFNLTANSSQTASLQLDMGSNVGYKLSINHLREGNDITVLVPTNEIYGKKTCPPPPATWNMSGYTVMTSPGIGTLANNAPVTAGQQVTFWHHVVNEGGSSTGQDIWSDTQVSGGVGTAQAGHNIGQFSPGQDKDASNNTITIPATATSGQTYCQRVGYQWTAYNNSAYSSGSWRCVVVQYGYALTPVVTVAPSNVVYVGQDFTFSYNVKNSTAYVANQVDWSIRQTVTTPAGVVTGTSIASGTKPATAGDWSPRAPDLIANIYPVGTKVCRYLLINSSTQAPNVPSEQGVCVLIAASPYAAIVGGNTWAGGSVDYATGYLGDDVPITGARPTSFGSFDEYGVFATGTVDYFGSAGKLGQARTASGMANGPLTFGSAVSLGNFTNSHKISNLVEHYAASSSTPVLNAAGQVSQSGVYVASGNVTITGMTGGNPHAVVYAPNDTVTITGDIVYNSAPAASFRDLPSLTIIAKNIIITSNVSQIAGNFYASGRFITCNEGPWSTGENASKASAITTTGVCSNRLVINGTVTVASQAAGSLVLNRSYGGTTTGQPAEMVRMRPESFLTPYENNLIFTTAHETELPARY
jgi:hypothetical protein